MAGNSSYFIEYPEDIRLYGLSFSTTCLPARRGAVRSATGRTRRCS
jgi:hypothetical protein